jgi:hypothetical protein
MNETAFRVGAVTWTVTGLGHSILHFVLPGDPELSAAMRASEIQIGPVKLDVESLNQGISLAMALAMIFAGALLWMIADVLRNDPDRLHRFGIVALVATVLALGIAVVWIPGPPLVTFAVATIAFGAALFAKTPARITSTR